ncbi:hypothetical protein [Actinoplanes subtropicus]|uniref:hypothetical protein n=1 Tax=Actinoplanes subtropicus TaxID=543632 RepID=UPI0004C3826F|nr:hypothetical protein [Actinoplanes subtropicus]
MSRLRAGTVKELVNALAADRHPGVTVTAGGRHAALTALATTVGAIADAIPALDCVICPREQERDRTRHDRRWYTVLADLDKAARDAEYLEAGMRAAARTCANMIGWGEPVLYHGSLTAQHGEYLMDGNCGCDPDDDRCEGLALTRRGRGVVLTCVNTHSISPAEFTDATGLHTAARIGPVLLGAIAALREPVDEAEAPALVRTLAGIVGHLGEVLTTWAEPIRRHTAGSWLLDMDTRGAGWRHRQSVTGRVDTAGNAATAIRGTLRHAAGTLATISDHPQQPRTAA